MLLRDFGYAVFHFVLAEKMKSAKNIWEPVFENVIILGFLMADTSSEQQNIYILLNMSHFYFIMSNFLVSCESHFQLQVLVHVRPARNNHCQ